MAEKPTTFLCLKQFNNAGVWQSYNDTKKNKPFSKRNLIYGFNGSGKTTLSRVFASLEQSVLKDRLPTTSKFSLELSEGSNVDQTNLAHPLKNNLLVFNEDFVVENLKWDESSATPIFYISKDSADAVEKLTALEELLDTANKSLKSDEAIKKAKDAAFEKFKTDVARRVRELANVEKLSQTFTKAHLVGEYTKQEYSNPDQLEADEIKRLKEIVNQNAPLPPIEGNLDIELDLYEKVTKMADLLGKTPGTILTGQLADHPDAVEWVGQGAALHKAKSLKDCLYCNNEISEERSKYLSDLFDDTWQKTSASIEEAAQFSQSEYGRLIHVYKNLPHAEIIQATERKRYEQCLVKVQSCVKDIGGTFNSLSASLKQKRSNPTQIVTVPDQVNEFINSSWKTNFQEVVEEYDSVRGSHNKAHEDFKKNQESASNNIKRHVLFDEQKSYRDQLEKCAELKASVAKNEAVQALHIQCGELKNEIQEHGFAAEEINKLLISYLGHKHIKLEPQDDGYQLVRGDGSVAENLSEGEKTAIAFCFFLTQIGAEGRRQEELVLVIDDPISSLDTAAKTHAFALMKKYTGKAAQVIILTHNLQFMHMVKRYFYSSNPDASQAEIGLFFLQCKDCGEDTNTRSTDLIKMPELLSKYESEYHYLFSIVHSAKENGESEYLFLLPNAIRKMLEIFLSFASPRDSGDFANALMGSVSDLKTVSTPNMSALERLVQVESHGTMDGAFAVPVLTTEESIRAAVAAIDYIQKRDPKHFKAMRKMILD